MSEIWPLHVGRQVRDSAANAIRPFNCLMLMPFEKRFEPISEVIRATVLKVLEEYDMNRYLTGELPHIERLDWVNSSGVINQEIWQRIAEADLVFCDITGYNPNVMFEAGVTAAWKEIEQVVFIKDRFFRQQSAFDIAPIRYTEYELTSDGIANFQKKVADLTTQALVRFPDQQGLAPTINLPINVDFKDNRDDLRFYTPPFAHRRVIGGKLEFGSVRMYSHGWASLGKKQFYCFELQFTASFSNSLPEAYIGVGLRSQHYFANYSHFFYLRNDGLVIITEPNDEVPPFYRDNRLREPTPIDTSADHVFRIRFSESELSLQVDDFNPPPFEVARMPKVFGPGLIRFQGWQTWMSLSQVNVRAL